MFYNFTYSPTHSNNGILSARKAMPMKEMNSDGDSSFAMDRRLYMRTPILSSSPMIISKKKWYGGSSVRDSSVVMENHVKNEIGVVSLNAGGDPMSFRATRILNADFINPYKPLMFFFLYISYYSVYFYSNLYYKHK